MNDVNHLKKTHQDKKPKTKEITWTPKGANQVFDRLRIFCYAYMGVPNFFKYPI